MAFNGKKKAFTFVVEEAEYVALDSEKKKEMLFL